MGLTSCATLPFLPGTHVFSTVFKLLQANSTLFKHLWLVTVWTPKMKKYSVKVMQRAIEALTERDKTQKYYVEAYQTLLSIWGDGKLNREGKEFIKKNFILTKKTDEMNSNTLKKN